MLQTLYNAQDGPTTSPTLQRTAPPQAPSCTAWSHYKPPLCTDWPHYKAPLCTGRPHHKAPLCTKRPHHKPPLCTGLPNQRTIQLRMPEVWRLRSPDYQTRNNYQLLTFATLLSPGFYLLIKCQSHIFMFILTGTEVPRCLLPASFA